VIEYVEINYAHDLTITELCQTAGTTERTLRYAFCDLVGMSPQRYLMQRRLHMARTCLKTAEPGVSIAAIATACGFRHPGRFAHYFETLFGEQPSSVLRT